jgi:hypothetical protein
MRLDERGGSWPSRTLTLPVDSDSEATFSPGETRATG